MGTIEAQATQLVIGAGFLAAIIHSLFSFYFLERAKKLGGLGDSKASQQSLFELLGHISIIFPLWLIPTFAFLYLSTGKDSLNILGEAGLAEPFANFTFIFLAFSKRVRNFFSAMISQIARVFGGSNVAWWLSCLVLGLLLDGFLSEVAVVVLVASAMKERFFVHHPSDRFSYATLAVIFCSLALGNLILPFNITATMDLTAGWGWTHWTILEAVSWRVIFSIFSLLLVGLALVKRELEKLPSEASNAPSTALGIDFSLLSYLLAFVAASFFKEVSAILVAIVAFFCVIERDREKAQHNQRLILPLIIALFNYAMEIYAFLLSTSVEQLYAWVGETSSPLLTLGLSALNQHIPGAHFVNALQGSSAPLQELGLLALAVGSGVAIFSNVSNIVACKLLKDEFPNGVVSGWRVLAYTAPLSLLSYGILKISYLFV